MNKLKPLLLATTLFCMLQGNAQTTPLMLDASSTAPSNALQDANGDINIGPTILSSSTCVGTYIKSVRNTGIFSCTGANPDFYTATHYVSSTELTDFIIKADGKVGIGTAAPWCPLDIKCKNWYTTPGDIPGEPIQLYEDPDGNILGGFLNVSDGTGNPGGAFLVLAKPDAISPAFGVYNNVDEVTPFAVLGNSTIAMGVDVSTGSTFAPEAQVNITKNNSYNYMLKIQNTDQSRDWFDVDNNGHVGIGIASESGATGIIYETNTDTKLDFATTSTTYHNAIRLGRLASVTSGHAMFTPTHQITEAGGDMVIDPGIADGGGNDVLKVDGNEKITGYLSVGIGSGTDMNAPSILGSTIALHHIYTDDHTGPTLDFFQEDAVNNGWNGQIRFGRKYNDGAEQCAMRHIIADNYTTGALDITPGVDASHTGSIPLAQVVHLNGNEEITKAVSIGMGSGTDFHAPSILGSTLALHHVHTDGVTGPTLDFFQEDDITGWNGQIRFGRKYNDGAEQCAIRHVIADNYTTGTLDITPGVDPTHTGSIPLAGIVRVVGKMMIGENIVNSGTHADAKLFVEGKIAAKYVVVTESDWGWPDHVFNSNYQLRSLPELESYITANHHLPEVPDECEVQDKGVNVGEMNATLLKKIEELTLYVLAQQKQMDKMKEELHVLSNH